MVVQKCKYPDPESGIDGQRSLCANLRSQFPKYGGGDAGLYRTGECNGDVLVAAQIDTVEACRNITEICAVKGLDMAFVAPDQLCASIGLLSAHGSAAFVHPQFQAAIGNVLKACTANAVAAGAWCNPENVADLTAMGYRFCTIGADIHTCQMAVRQTVDDASIEMSSPAKTKPNSVESVAWASSVCGEGVTPALY